MRVKLDISVILALGIMASAATSVRYANIVFNASTRWLLLLALLGIILFSNRLFVGLRKWNVVLGSLFLIYGVTTTFWSTIPALSASKSILYLLCGLGYSSTAAMWVKRTERQNILHILWPLVALTLFAGLSGSIVSDATQQMNEDVSIYRGLTFNSNFLGLLTLVSLPLPLWIAARPQSSRRQRRMAYVLLLVLLALLLQTVSRASILAAGVIMLFFLVGLGAWRVSALLFGSVVAVLMLSSFSPQIVDELVARFLYKGNTQNATLLNSREDSFAASFEAAQAGGVFGLGFGVSDGFDNYELGQGSAQYGREKSNTTLAIIEEMGIVGLVLFASMMISILAFLFGAARLPISREDRLLLFILMGTLVALLIHAQFEAWLLSPGGAATPIFWTFIGLSTAVSLQIRRESLAACRLRRN